MAKKSKPKYEDDIFQSDSGCGDPAASGGPLKEPPRKALIVDDDPVSLSAQAEILDSLGWKVISCPESTRAMEMFERERPSLVSLELLMREDGLDLCRRMRSAQSPSSVAGETKILIISAKPYEKDRTRALEAGADGYIVKPFTIEKFHSALGVSGKMSMTFWGVRGTLPVPGQKAIKYGGNTSCVSLSFPTGALFVFDAGTGIKELSSTLLARKAFLGNIHLFISHPHWDHINAFPFFVPLYLKETTITVYGPYQDSGTNMLKIMSDQMDGPYFPVGLREFSAKVDFRDLREGEYNIEGISVKSMLLTHPGNCLGYRVDYRGKSFCYITDNELYPEKSEFFNRGFRDKLVSFIKDSDVLIHDSTYFDDEYRKKVHWGHSPITQVADLAATARINNLYFVHHDPDQSDADIDRKLDIARTFLENAGSKVRCHAPSEGHEVEL